MNKCKYILIFTLVVALLMASIWYVFIYLSSNPGRIYHEAEKLSQLEEVYGGPFAVFSDYPPTYGRDMVTSDEIENGYRITVYIVRKTPNAVMVLVKHRENSDLIESREVYVP